MTEKACVIQCSSVPMRYCHTSTERPNDAASDSTTVPTVTNDAISARVMISMTMKISVMAPTAAIIRSHFAPTWMSL
jgi:hypothetical protein